MMRQCDPVDQNQDQCWTLLLAVTSEKTCGLSVTPFTSLYCRLELETGLTGRNS